MLGESDHERATPRPSRQPNVPGRGIVASYRPSFWALVAGIGVAAGLAGAALIALLKLVERAAWSYRSGSFVAVAEDTAPLHHMASSVPHSEQAAWSRICLRYVRGRR